MAQADTRPLPDGPRPKHLQLRDALIELVRTELGPDQPIPSERVLMSTYSVSRATVRKTLDGLVADGLLRRTHGKGTFVARPRLESQLHLASFTQDMRRRGLTPSTRLLRVAREQPPEGVAAALGLAPGEPAWHLQRLRLADGDPIALERGWYRAAELPDLDRQDLTGSLYRVLAETYGLRIDHGEQTLWGEAADTETARLLDAPLHTPLLVFRRISSAAGQPLEHVVSWYRGDRYQLHMSLDATPSSSDESPEGNHS